MLRYLADAYKALRQTVPEDAKTEELIDLIEWLGELVRQVDSSPARRVGAAASTPPTTAVEARDRGEDRRPSPPTPRAFRVLVRNAVFRRVELAALRRYDELGELDGEHGLGTPTTGREAIDGTSPSTTRSAPARTPAARPCSSIERSRTTGHVRQIFDDPAGDHDWGISAEVDLDASDEQGTPAIKITDVSQLGAGVGNVCQLVVVGYPLGQTAEGSG